MVISRLKRITAAEHGIAVQQLCPSATEVVKRLQDAGYEAYIVGGSVRDLLLGKLPKDFDIATDATPEEVKVVFPRAHLIGRRFRLAHVRLNGALLEVATFRGQHDEAAGGQRHDNGRILRDNVFGSVEEDAIRRDFTINALFLDPVNGEIRDYVGGYKDLSARRLKLIGDPETRYREDPVRLLRAARFVAKLGVDMDPATQAPIEKMAHLLEQIPPARLFEEVCKLFMTGHATRTLESLQRFHLTRSLFPVLPEKGGRGKIQVTQMLLEAMRNTDERISRDMSVTPAFMFATLLWMPVRERAATYVAGGATELQALERAGEEVISLQVQRTAVPRRFSTVTRQIWETQARFAKTRGKRALRILAHPRFRAAYDFLLLRAVDEPELEAQVMFWTDAQENAPPPPAQEANAAPARKKRSRRRSRRGRKKTAASPG